MAGAGDGGGGAAACGGERSPAANGSGGKQRRSAGRTPSAIFADQVLARIYGVFALKCGGCGRLVRLIAFITEPAMVSKIPAHAGETITAPAIATACSPPGEVNAQQLIAPEAVEAIPELEFDQTAHIEAEAGHYRSVADAGAHAEPIPELEFDQTLGW